MGKILGLSPTVGWLDQPTCVQVEASTYHRIYYIPILLNSQQQKTVRFQSLEQGVVSRNLPLLACTCRVPGTLELCLPLCFHVLPVCHPPGPLEPCMPGCLPRQMWSSNCFPSALHLSRSCFPAVSQMWSPTCRPVVSGCFTDVVFRLSPNGIPVCSDMLSQWFSTCLRQLPVVSQMGSPNNLSVHVSPTYLPDVVFPLSLKCFPWPWV